MRALLCECLAERSLWYFTPSAISIHKLEVVGALGPLLTDFVRAGSNLLRGLCLQTLETVYARPVGIFRTHLRWLILLFHSLRGQVSRVDTRSKSHRSYNRNVIFLNGKILHLLGDVVGARRGEGRVSTFLIDGLRSLKQRVKLLGAPPPSIVYFPIDLNSVRSYCPIPGLFLPRMWFPSSRFVRLRYEAATCLG